MSTRTQPRTRTRTQPVINIDTILKNVELHTQDDTDHTKSYTVYEVCEDTAYDVAAFLFKNLKPIAHELDHNKKKRKEAVMGNLHKHLLEVRGKQFDDFIKHESPYPETNAKVLFTTRVRGPRTVQIAHLKNDITLVMCAEQLAPYFNKMLHVIYGEALTDIKQGVMVCYENSTIRKHLTKRHLFIPEVDGSPTNEFLIGLRNTVLHTRAFSPYITGFLCYTKQPLTYEQLYAYIKM